MSRQIELLAIAVFIETLFLCLHRSLVEQRVVGRYFFKVWAVLLVAISGIPIFVRDRLKPLNEHLNGWYKA